jgi:hypothetical protein
VSASGQQKDVHRRGSIKLSLNQRHPSRIADADGGKVWDKSAALADLRERPVSGKPVHALAIVQATVVTLICVGYRCGQGILCDKVVYIQPCTLLT